MDNEFTLKRLARERGRVACLRADTHRQVLRPENKAYLPARCACLRASHRQAQAGPVIRPKGELEIFGVVVGQFRLSACYLPARSAQAGAQAGKYR